MSPFIVLHGKTERILQQMQTLGELDALCIVISSDANTGKLVGRFIEEAQLEGLNAEHLGTVLKHMGVYGFGLDARTEKTPMELSLQPVRSRQGSPLETNLSFFFDVTEEHYKAQDCQNLC